MTDQSQSSTSTATAPSPPPKTRKLSRSRGAASGIMLVLLGAWGALAPFIGPTFSFGYTEDKAWTWTAARGWYEVLPGSVAFVGGLLLLLGASRLSTLLGAWMGILAGAWFVVGPPLTSELTLGSLGTPRGTNSGQRVAETLTLFSGLGAIIIFFAATAFGRLSVVTVRDQRAAERREQERVEAEESYNRQMADHQAAERDRLERERYDRENAVNNADGPDSTDNAQHDTRAYGDPAGNPNTDPNAARTNGENDQHSPYHSALGYREGEQAAPYTPPNYGRHDANLARGTTESTQSTQGEPTTGYTPGYPPPPTERP